MALGISGLDFARFTSVHLCWEMEILCLVSPFALYWRVFYTKLATCIYSKETGVHMMKNMLISQNQTG